MTLEEIKSVMAELGFESYGFSGNGIGEWRADVQCQPTIETKDLIPQDAEELRQHFTVAGKVLAKKWICKHDAGGIAVRGWWYG